MLRVQSDKAKSLLVNWNKQFVCWRQSGLHRNENGELVAALDGITLEASVSSDDLIEEHHKRSRLSDLAIFQLDH